MGLTTPSCKKDIVQKPYKENSRTDTFTRPKHAKRKNEMFIATWNVRSLFQSGASRVLEDELERYSIQIAAIQEIRWKTTEYIELKKYVLINSGNRKNEFGTGFMIHKDIKGSIIDYKLVNERICILRMRSRFFNTSYISVHAPHEKKEEIVKDEFYEQLEREYNSLPQNDVKIIIGDFNAKVGREMHHRTVTGGHSKHELSDENGLRLVDFAAGRNLKICSTAFPHKNIHKETWLSPDGTTRNQIDHVVVDARHATNILDVRSLRGADCNSDHFLVRVKMRHRIKISKYGKGERIQSYNVELLKDNEKRRHYQEGITKELKKLDLTKMEIEDGWKNIKQIVKGGAEEVLGFTTKISRNKWYDEDCDKTIRERNRARLKMIVRTTRASMEDFKEKRRIASRTCRRKKRLWENKRLLDMQNDFMGNQNRKYFKFVKEIKTGFQPRVNLCLDKNGNLISEEEKVLKRWKEFFSDLLNRENSVEGGMSIEDDVDGNPASNTIVEEELAQLPPTLNEIRDVITRIRNNKAPGADNITGELIKYGGEELANSISILVQKIWSNIGLTCQENEFSIIVPYSQEGI